MDSESDATHGQFFFLPAMPYCMRSARDSVQGVTANDQQCHGPGALTYISDSRASYDRPYVSEHSPALKSRSAPQLDGCASAVFTNRQRWSAQLQSRSRMIAESGLRHDGARARGTWRDGVSPEPRTAVCGAAAAHRCAFVGSFNKQVDMVTCLAVAYGSCLPSYRGHTQPMCTRRTFRFAQTSFVNAGGAALLLDASESTVATCPAASSVLSWRQLSDPKATAAWLPLAHTLDAESACQGSLCQASLSHESVTLLRTQQGTVYAVDR